jgi:hypothetical protein
MPNWCCNEVTFSGDDRELLELIAEAAVHESLLGFLSPVPTVLPNELKQSWRVDAWGTKWDVQEVECRDVQPAGDGRFSVGLSFYSAWAPPTGAYTSAEELGVDVDAVFWEPGMGFCGVYTGGEVTECHYTGADDPSIPEACEAAFNISWALAEDAEDADTT